MVQVGVSATPPTPPAWALHLRGPHPRAGTRPLAQRRDHSSPGRCGAVWVPGDRGQLALLPPCPRATCAGEAGARGWPRGARSRLVLGCFLRSLGWAGTKLNFRRKESNKGSVHPVRQPEERGPGPGRPPARNGGTSSPPLPVGLPGHLVPLPLCSHRPPPPPPCCLLTGQEEPGRDPSVPCAHPQSACTKEPPPECPSEWNHLLAPPADTTKPESSAHSCASLGGTPHRPQDLPQDEKTWVTRSLFSVDPPSGQQGPRP